MSAGIFRPLPGLANPHVQTVLANAMPRSHRRLRGSPRLVVLADGDRLVAHDNFPRRWREGDAWVLLVHGLAGSHASPYLERIARNLLKAGVATTRLDLRGAGEGLRHARKFYCAACTNDLHTVVMEFHQRFPGSPILVAGFSLGGNIVLRWAGEYAGQTPNTLAGLASVSAPVDMVRCSELIEKQPFYNRYYVRRLIDQVHRHYALFPDLKRVQFPKKALLRDFDEIYTAPNWGYASAFEYYRQASALPWLANLRVPTYLLTSRDDPFVWADSLREVSLSDAVKPHVTEHGGHLGYLGRDRFGGIRWFEAEIAHWLLNQIDRSDLRRPT